MRPRSEARSPLHEVTGGAVSDDEMRDKLTVDEFLALSPALSGFSGVDRELVEQVLLEFDLDARARVVRDIGDDADRWSPYILIRFLKFRALWESNDNWWETRYRHGRQKYSLSLRNMKAIIERSQAQDVEDIIEPGWLQDWRDITEDRPSRFATFGRYVQFKICYLSCRSSCQPKCRFGFKLSDIHEAMMWPYCGWFPPDGSELSGNVMGLPPAPTVADLA